MISGTHGDYSWIEWPSPSAYLYDFIHAFPAIVLWKYIAVTSCDSGPFIPTDEERRDGWFADREIAYHGPIGDVNVLPNDQFDEWYIFSQLRKLPPIEVFINYGVFSLTDPNELFSGGNAELVADRYQQQERFWQQLIALAPETYLAEGDRLLFVTRDQALFGTVVGWSGIPADRT